MKKLFVILYLLICVAGSVYAEPYNPPADAKLEYNKGVDYYKLGQYDNAMGSFRRAIGLDANYIDAYYNLGAILEYLHQDEAALNIFQQIMVRKPDDYESVYKAASISNRLGQIDKAKTYLSLIPPESNVYKFALNLAHSMNTDMQTIKAQQLTGISQTVTSQNDMYNNIPSPTGLTTDKNGNLYVACFSDNMIYKITPDGKQIVFLKDSRINGPIGLVSDAFGNIYVSNYNNNNVLKITTAGTVSVLIGNIQKPYGLHVNGSVLYVSSQGSNSVLKYKL